MNSRILLTAIAALTFPLLTAPAQASKYHHHHAIHHHYRHIDRLSPTQAYSAAQACVFDNNGHQVCQIAPNRANDVPIRSTNRTNKVRYSASDNEGIIGGRPSGCPHAFCGCGTSLHIFGRIIPSLNLAANWLRFPRTFPAPGMVAVRNHHVFAIERVIDSETVIAFDSNSGGHRTRIHAVNLRGYSVRDPHGLRVAMR